MNVNLVVEVTRRCKLKCEHCLRGPAQNKDMDAYFFRNSIERFTNSELFNISCLTLTGGEPLLNIPALKECLSLWKNFSMIYIATSGQIDDLHSFDYDNDTDYYNQTFDLLSNLKKAMYGELYIDLSTDVYHKKNVYDFQELAAIYGFELGNKNNTKYNEAIAMGRAHTNQLGTKDATEYLFPIDYEEDPQTLIININGDVFPGCDYSYKAYERFKKKLCIGNVITDSSETLLNNYDKLVGKETKILYYNEKTFKIKLS